MDRLPTTTTDDPVLRQADLEAVASIAMLRLPLRGPECARAARMRTLLSAASELSRVLASHTHTMLVNCQGSHGTGDPTLVTAELTDALRRYSDLVRQTADEYRRFLSPADAAQAGAGAPIALFALPSSELATLRAG